MRKFPQTRKCKQNPNLPGTLTKERRTKEIQNGSTLVRNSVLYITARLIPLHPGALTCYEAHVRVPVGVEVSAVE